MISGDGNKLMQQHQMEIAKLLGWFWKPSEITNHLKEKYGIEMLPNNIAASYQNSEKWKPIIDKFRDDYTKSMYEVPLFHKRKRLDELQRHYDHHMGGNDWHSALDVIKSVRDEVDQKFGDVSFHFTHVTQYNDMSDEEIQHEKSKVLEQLERVKKVKKLLEVKNAGSPGEKVESPSKV